jgi:RNA polymerase sigma factor (sigma-70 family)
MKHDAAARVRPHEEEGLLSLPSWSANDTAGDGDARESGEHMTTDEAYRRYGQRILKRIRRRDVGPESARDLLHDVYVVAIARSSTRQPLVSVLGTLLAIMRRVLRNYLRRRRNRARPGWESDAADTAEALSAADARDAHALVEAAFARLPAKDGALLRQIYFEGRTVPAISTSLGCPPDTVWSRYRRAKALLIDALVQLDSDLLPDGEEDPPVDGD